MRLLSSCPSHPPLTSGPKLSGVLLPLIAVVVYLLSLPGVGNAEARVEALVISEGGRVLRLRRPPA